MKGKNEVPARIRAAMVFAKHCCTNITDPKEYDVSKGAGRELSPQERAAYHSSLELLRLYFSGEMNEEQGNEGPEKKSNRRPVGKSGAPVTSSTEEGGTRSAAEDGPAADASRKEEGHREPDGGEENV